jgi:hypothetical protein
MKNSTEGAAHAPHESLWTDLSKIQITNERRWFAEGAIEGEPLICLAGPERKGKSWLMMALAVAVAGDGEKWIGRFPLHKHGGVIYLDGEYGAVEFKRRIERLARGMGLDPALVCSPERMRYHYSTDVVLAYQATAQRGVPVGISDPVLKEIHADVLNDVPALIVLDPLRNHLTGDENAMHVIAEANRCLRALKAAGNCPLIYSHHLNKSGTFSGSRAIITMADLPIEGTDAKTIESVIYTTKGRTVRTADPLAKPFSITVEHTDDEQDEIAGTRIAFVQRNAGDEDRVADAPSVPSQQTQDKFDAALREHGWPVSAKEFAEASGMSTKTVYAVCKHLAHIGHMTERPQKDGKPNGWDYVGPIELPGGAGEPWPSTEAAA